MTVKVICTNCGDVGYGDGVSSVETMKQTHRERSCHDARFEVMA